ncbi:MAG: hypothetical protein M1813_003632 [Trichoglossum hirsutum]|nr:MAG: hypothetical protein M1813_003632 [Trichoglossum hirsutum]
MSLKSSSQAWEGLTVDYGPLHALVDKIGQQMYVAIKHEFSETGFTFEFYLGVDVSVDIRTVPDSDIQKSKAHEIYRSLVIRKQSPKPRSDHTQSPTSTPESNSVTFQGDGLETFNLLQQSSPDVANWPQEMDLAKLPSVNERSCEQCWLKTIEIPIIQGSTFFSAIARHAFALRMLQRQQILLKLFLDAKILNKEADRTPGSRGQLTSVQRLMGLRDQISKARLSFLTYHHQAIVQVLGKFENNTSVK